MQAAIYMAWWKRDFLIKTGSSRGAVYHLSGMDIIGPEDVFDSSNLESRSPNLEPSSPNSGRDNLGRLISESHKLPFIDDLQELRSGFLDRLKNIAEEPRGKKRMARESMKKVLCELVTGHYITISCLAELVKRDSETLKGQYLSQMVKEGSVEIAFPRTPNDPRQAYTKASPSSSGSS